MTKPFLNLTVLCCLILEENHNLFQETECKTNEMHIGYVKNNEESLI